MYKTRNTIFHILYLQTEFGGFSRLYYNILTSKLAREDSSMWIVKLKVEFKKIPISLCGIYQKHSLRNFSKVTNILLI